MKKSPAATILIQRLRRLYRKPSMPPFTSTLSTTSSASHINLLRGWPNPKLLPAAQLKAASQTALSAPDTFTPGLLYGPDPGFQPLRESIVEKLDAFYGPTTRRAFPSAKVGDGNGEGKGEIGSLEERAERICITGGASQNLANVLLVYSDPAVTTVWIVAPCYFMACNILDDAGVEMRAVAEGEEGIDLEALEKELKEAEKSEKKPLKAPRPWSKIYKHIIYCVPTFSNPSGRTMTLSARQSLVVLARKYDALIVTDDVYDYLQWPTDDSCASTLQDALLPRLVDVDRSLPPSPEADGFGNAMSNGSFSKITGPGVRTGWADASPRFSYGLSQCGASRSGGAPSQMTATIIDALIRSGDLDLHIESVLKLAYQQRHRILVRAIEEYLMPVGVRMKKGTLEGRDVFGGYFVWVDLPAGVGAEVVSERCKERENLVVAPGRIFEVRGDESVKFDNSLRLCFAWEGEEELEEGVRRLGRVIKDVADGKGADGREKITKEDFGEFK